MQTANFEIALQPRAADDLIFPNNACINTVPKLLQNHKMNIEETNAQTSTWPKFLQLLNVWLI